ncbi:lytic transglycosylase domain-containing protein [Cypionkella sinensis]|uniref:Lytic transglycosylase domain-containing protein n=1 Tax=Cypionkella sinensis TaxID=1756043 RepID=A0ABV7IZA5_9RHOB
MSNQPIPNKYRGCIAIALLAIILCGPAQLRAAANPCDLAAQQAAQNSEVPLELLMAISRVETGRQADGTTQPWPWAINQGGQGHWFDTADQAISFASDLLAQGVVNFDAGCFQINLHWHSKNFGSLADMFDPQTNARYAASYLSQLFQSEGGWPEAVAAYHSRSPDQAQAYLTKVEAALTDLRATSTVPPASEDMIVAADLAPRVNRFPLLQAGARGSAGSLVPLTEGAIPLFVTLP